MKTQEKSICYIEPLVKILVAHCQKSAARVPERRLWGAPDALEPNRQPARAGAAATPRTRR